MAGYNAHDDGDLYGTPHFLQTAVYYTDSDTDPDTNDPDTTIDDTSEDDNDAYQLHIPDEDIHGIEAIADILNGVNLTWEMDNFLPIQMLMMTMLVTINLNPLHHPSTISTSMMTPLLMTTTMPLLTAPSPLQTQCHLDL